MHDISHISNNNVGKQKTSSEEVMMNVVGEVMRHGVGMKHLYIYCMHNTTRDI